MIEASNLTKWYGPTRAIDRISFTIAQGEIVGFLGPNGAGKSTTMRILTGFIPPTYGTASIAGFNVLKQSNQARATIGYMPEANPLYPEMRVEEYLHFRGKLMNMGGETRRKRIDVVCDRCGLDQIRKRIIGQLSKGNRQRVGLAQALLHDPKVLILDEPTAGLDPSQISHFRDFLEELRAEHAILLSSHILGEIEKTVDRAIVLREGQIAAEGPIDELRGKVTGGQRVTLEVKANPGVVKQQLEKLEGVRSVETTSAEGWCRATIVQRDGQDVRERVLQEANRQAWSVRQLARRRANLEDFYLQIFTEEEAEVGA